MTTDSDRTEYDKLVRDDIPEIIRADDTVPETHVADDAEYERRLKAKLREEADEFYESEKVEELADVLEVIDALCKVNGVDREELDRIRESKAEDSGRFEDRIVLEAVVE